MKHLKSFRLLSRQRRRKTVSLINSRKKEFVISWYLFPWLFCLVFGFVVPEFRLSLEEVTISVRLWCEAAPERSLVINGWRILSAESAIFGELIYCDNLWFFLTYLVIAISYFIIPKHNLIQGFVLWRRAKTNEARVRRKEIRGRTWEGERAFTPFFAPRPLLTECLSQAFSTAVPACKTRIAHFLCSLFSPVQQLLDHCHWTQTN